MPVLCLALLSEAAPPAPPESPATTEFFIIDRFSGEVGRDGLPEGWKPLTFRKIERHTDYTVVEEEGGEGERFLKAESRGSASGVYKEVEIDLGEYPVLRWRWKVEGVVKQGDAARKEGDDYAARVYVTFAYDPEATPFLERAKYKLLKTLYGSAPANAINYIWANKLKKGEAVPNPYTEKAMMVAVESGEGLAGRWVSEERNVYEDYKALFHFHAEPPVVTGIAVMTDTDNTGGSAVAYYDDLVFGR
ncbi:MAG: DUF3047 domain-containing protein [Thermodesulfobacteriota bacterium]